MSHSVFQIMPMDIRTFSKPLLPLPAVRRAFPFKTKASQLLWRAFPLKTRASQHLLPAVGRVFPSKTNVIKASIDSRSSVMYAPVMKGEKYGALGADTLEISKLGLTQTQTNSSPEPQLSTDGGGGNMGNNVNLGGGGGGSEGGAGDDDYFDDFDDGDGRYMHIFISGSFLKVLSRAYIRRMVADPTFLYKLLLEQAVTIGCSVSWEIKNRKERIKQEWDLALLNVLTVMACNAIVVWSLAPCYSFGNKFYFDWRNRLQILPNNIFEKSYLLRKFDLQKRIHSFFYKAVELCMVGLTVGAVQGSLWKLLAAKKEGRLSVTTPCVINYALGYGAFLGLYTNIRYQLLCGFDRNYFGIIGLALFFSSTALRVLNVQVGEASRLAWLGIEVDPLAHSDDLLKACSRPTEGLDQPSSERFTS
ncbi:protein RETICULATA-RELATED 1, chloroplastic-like [Nicotiana tomentosiformis]|uniref:protein RETICULATA-RELATED 1, chloroplastic-like n=1 Tax=Nicotiana tomentosiformis TaxID=4098 RepID=UPI00051C09E1|nr:protein RETICULATA-RELATED 1, chloroplastic-like [Nicotiana tomentosiformis]